MTRPRKHRTFAFLAVAALLMLAAAGNVLAEGVHASSVQLYAGLPGLGGRLVDRANRRMPDAGREPRVLITTVENAPMLRLSWAAAERAGAALDPGAERLVPHGAVVLSETHSEGRVHIALVHPDCVDARIPARHAVARGAVATRAAATRAAATRAAVSVRSGGSEAEGSPGAPGGRAVLSAAAGAGRRSGRAAPLRTPGSRARPRTRAAQGARG